MPAGILGVHTARAGSNTLTRSAVTGSVLCVHRSQQQCIFFALIICPGSFESCACGPHAGTCHMSQDVHHTNPRRLGFWHGMCQLVRAAMTPSHAPCYRCTANMLSFCSMRQRSGTCECSPGDCSPWTLSLPSSSARASASKRRPRHDGMLGKRLVVGEDGEGETKAPAEGVL